MIKFKEFKINDYLTLKLMFSKTVIYIGGKRFRKCKFLLLEIPENIIEASLSTKFFSIDEAAENLDISLEPRDGKVFKYNIPPETEFWGHCSNIQAWYENGYDTRLLHSNLAFPLLQKLTEVGDPQALKVFKEEIAERYNNGIESVRKYLKEQEFLNYLTIEEFHSYIDKDEYEVVNKLRRIQPHVDRLGIQFKKGKITRLIMNGYKLKKVPSAIRKLKSLEHLELSYNLLETLPEWIGELTSLRELQLYDNRLKTLPESFGELKALQILKASNNNLRSLPDSIGNLKSLRVLELHSNLLLTIPKTIGSLESLRELDLEKNLLSVVPDSIGKLENLEMLILRNNKLTCLPDYIKNLRNLRILSIGSNKIGTLSNSYEKLQKLESIDISNNPINKMPEFIYNLLNLNKIDIRRIRSIESQISLDKFNNNHITIFLNGQKIIKK